MEAGLNQARASKEVEPYNMYVGSVRAAERGITGQIHCVRVIMQAYLCYERALHVRAN